MKYFLSASQAHFKAKCPDFLLFLFCLLYKTLKEVESLTSCYKEISDYEIKIYFYLTLSALFSEGTLKAFSYIASENPQSLQTLTN